MAFPLQEQYNLLTDFGFKRVFGSEPNKQLLVDFELSATERDLAILKEIELAGNGWEKRQHDSCFRRSQSNHHAIAGWHLSDRGRWEVWTSGSDLSHTNIQGTATDLSVTTALHEADAALAAEIDKPGQGIQSPIGKLLDSIKQTFA